MSLLHHEKTGAKAGLLIGTCTALIGDASTGKSALAEQFLAVGFRELIGHFIKVYARFWGPAGKRGKELDKSWEWVLHQLAASVLLEPKKSSRITIDDNPGKAVRDALDIGWRLSSAVLRQEYKREHWVADWKNPDLRKKIEGYLVDTVHSTSRSLTRTKFIFALSCDNFDPDNLDPEQRGDAILSLFNHPNLRWPAVLLTTSNKQAREVAIDCLAYFQNEIQAEMRRWFEGSRRAAWQHLEKCLIELLERQIIVRRFDIANHVAPVVLHVIIRNLLEAKKLIFGPFFPKSQETHKIKADRIRLVIDDLRVLCNISPDIVKDSAFLPFLTFQLERSGITSLLVYTDAVRPDKRPEDETSRELLSLSKRSILTWSVPFEGRTRFALTVIPPIHLEHNGTVRELKLNQFDRWELGGKAGEKIGRISVPAVTPKFELYSGIEEGKPLPVPLAIYLYAETKQFAVYAEEENALFRELFASVEPGSAVNPARVIFPLDWTRYLAMRDYTHLTLDKLDGHTMVFQVDGSWALAGECALLDQKEYMQEKFATDEDERSAQDPFHLFEGKTKKHKRRDAENVASGEAGVRQDDKAPEPARRCHYFENSQYSYEKYRYKNEDQIPCAKSDRVPFMWDFGFVLSRSAPWQAAFDETLHGTLTKKKAEGTAIDKRQRKEIAKTIPFAPDDNVQAVDNFNVRTVFERLSEPLANENGAISWRMFFGACRSVADLHREQTGAPAVAFDISASSPETINALILEIWFSEILLEYKLRGNADAPKFFDGSKDSKNSLEEILLGDCSHEGKAHIVKAFSEFKRDYWKFMLPERNPGSSDDLSADEVERMKMVEREHEGKKDTTFVNRLNDLFRKLPLGAFCLYKTWLLLLEVLDFEDYFDHNNPFTFKLGRSASMQAVASRHWYKTACSFATHLYETEGIHDAMVPFRLPGSFSTRGDWFLGSPRSSRSRLLARHAFDLLCSRRANLTRMQHGLGLPVRDVVLDDDQACDQLRTALRCRIRESQTEKVVRSTQIPYGRLAELGERDADGFRWLWRSQIRNYDRQSRTLQKWTARLFRWTVELRQHLAGKWQGGFIAYDRLTCRRFAEIYEYPSFVEFARHCDLLVAELKASSRNQQ